MANPKLNPHQLAGWYGLSALLLAYTLNSLGHLSHNDPLFQLLNLSGALALMLISYHKKVKQLLILNTIWATIAAYALLTLI